MPLRRLNADDAEFIRSLSNSELRRRLTQRGVYLGTANLMIARRENEEVVWTIGDALGYPVD